MKLLPASAVLLLGIAACSRVIPDLLPPSSIPDQARALPSYVHLSFTGVAFWKAKLYVGTNIGLLEITGNRASALYQWSFKDSVVEGPWVDRGGDALWFWDSRTLDFRRWDNRGWGRTGLPPKDGYYSRGNILGAFRGCSDATGFWLEGAGLVWKWDRQKLEWAPQEFPRGRMEGIAASGEGLYALIAGPLSKEIMKPWDLELHLSDGTRWERVGVAPSRDVIERVVATAAGGTYLTMKGELVQFNRRGFERLEMPGVCEAIAATSDGTLLASLRSQGIFERRGDQWKLRYPYPYPEKEGKHWAFLAESNGRIAFATCEDAQVVDWEKGTRAWTGTTAVWVSKGDILERVRLE